MEAHLATHAKYATGEVYQWLTWRRLDVELVEAWPIKVDKSKGGVGETYLTKFHPGKVPALERPDGYSVYECIAVSVYRKPLLSPCLFLSLRTILTGPVAKQDPNTKLLGSSLEEEGTVLQYVIRGGYHTGMG